MKLDKLILFLYFNLLVSCSYVDDFVATNQLTNYTTEDSHFIYCVFYENIGNDLIHIEKLKVSNKQTKEEVLNENLNIEVPINYLQINIAEDYNFDGHNDISLLTYAGNYNNNYTFWLYDSLTNDFKHFTEMDNIYNPFFIKGSKIICSKYRVGLSEFYFSKYIWNHNKIQLVEKYEEIWYDKGHLSITKRLDNGTYFTKDSLISDMFVNFLECIE